MYIAFLTLLTPKNWQMWSDVVFMIDCGNKWIHSEVKPISFKPIILFFLYMYMVSYCDYFDVSHFLNERKFS